MPLDTGPKLNLRKTFKICPERLLKVLCTLNDVLISSLICRAQKRLNDKVIVVNKMLKRVCKLNGLVFIDNSNICAENLFEDGLHLKR